MLLAVARARVGVAVGGVVRAAGLVAVARRAALRPEVEVVHLAPIALVTRHARLALALALRVALQAAGPCDDKVTSSIFRALMQEKTQTSCGAVRLTPLVTQAVDADAVLPRVVVVLAALAVGSRTVAHAVQAVATVTCLLVEVFVEVAPAREAVAVAGCA